MALLGSYQIGGRIIQIALQAAASRVWQVCFGGGFNGAGGVGSGNGNGVTPSFIVPKQLTLEWFQTAAQTATFETSLDLFRVGATVTMDNNGVTFENNVGRMIPGPVPSALVGWSGAGNVAAGMTGGTYTNPQPIDSLGNLLFLALPAAATNMVSKTMVIADGLRNIQLLAGEALILRNRVVYGAAGTSSCYFSFVWEEWA